jgi:AraC-like DNA-binding protein
MGAYLEIAPPAALRGHLECLWMHRIDEPPPPEGRRLLPSGRVDFVWIGGLGVRVSGPQSRYTQPPDLGTMLAFGARFHPGAAPSAFRTPADSMVDTHVALDAIDPRFAARLDDRLLHASDPLTALAEELARRLRHACEPDPAVREAVRLLGRGTTVAATAERTFVSERALQRRFAEHVGYGPKTLQRVLRFQRFLGALPHVPLARAALLAGYADQPHLSRETRRLTGLTPARLASWTH